jgi:hypothetical protein
MPYAIKRLFDDPVILVEFIGTVSARDLAAIREKSLAMTRTMRGGHVWRIIDTRALSMDLDDLLDALREVTADGPDDGTPHPTFREVAVVMPASQAEVSADRAEQSSAKNCTLPMFDSLDAALEYVRR